VELGAQRGEPKTSGRKMSVAPAAPLQAAAPGDVLISEFRSRGPGGPPDADEFIELFNRTTGTVLITGWTLAKSADCGAAVGAPIYTFGVVSLASGQHYLIAGLSYSGAVPADASTDISLDDPGGLALIDGASTIIDQVGMCSTTAYLEGTRLVPLAGLTDQSYDRDSGPGGSCVDTDNNFNDFALRSPSNPQNSSSPATVCGVVISEFRSRGPSSNSHETDEFVELFNRTAGTVSLAGWMLWRSADCTPASTSFYPIPVTASLAPGQHYLIGGLNYSGAVPADNSPLVNIGVADGGGLALVDAASVVMDRVGMCNTTTYFEGTPLSPLAGNSDQSYDRNMDPGGSCTDSNDNAADFFLRSPSDPQNSLSPLTVCGNSTPTPPATNTPTVTSSPSNTPTKTPTRTPQGSRRLTINEVGWAGTEADPNAQWIELHNNNSSQPLNLLGWSVETANNSLAVDLVGTIPPDGYFLLVHGSSALATSTPTPGGTAACVGFDPADLIIYDQVFTGTFSQTGQALYLINPGNGFEDTADRSGGRWPAGQLSPAKSMERSSATIADTAAGAWFTFEGDTTSTPRDCDGNRVRGTPKRSNWAFTVTRTPSPTAAPPRKPTPRPPTPFAHMVINEFLPRAGTDWNQDGAVDVYDEFIEVKNLGPLDVDLKNWKLDDEANLGSAPFTLPSVKLKPDERAVFYGAQTHILLDDSGDSVRLINPRAIVFDARSYGPVTDPDQSHCRIPDGYYWRRPCFPTPGNENSLTGSAPAPPPPAARHPAPCLLADTVPEPFRQAECAAYGDDIWSRTYWDDLAGTRQFPVPDRFSKWKTIVE
jgi:hypothetical protein